jgi:hypothetical protein
MAAGDFSAAASYANIIAALSSMWDSSVINEDDEAPLVTAQNILPYQSARLREEYNAMGKCIDRKIWWVNYCDYDADYSGTSFDDTLTCDVPEGTEGEAFSKTYGPNLFIHKTIRVADQDCDNETFGVNLSANAINAGIRAVRKQLCTSLATFLQSNAQANGWSGTPGTVAGTITQFTSAEFNANLIHTLRLIAMKNQVSNYRMINGTNFWEIAQQAQFGQCCENTGDRNLFANFPMNWDIWLDDVLSGNYTFVFDPSRIGFTNVTKFDSMVPVQIHNYTSGEQIYSWRVEDPILQWRSISAEGVESLVPVAYDVEYKRTCTGRGTRGQFQYAHDFSVQFEGMIDTAPASCNGGTKILQFENTGA